MKHNYDTVAWFYDRMARLVFGSVQADAQVYLLQAIPPGARVLIIGGGTGQVLEDMVHVHAAGLVITYIDASEKMIAQARKRNVKENGITFIMGRVEDVVLDGQFDVVMTPFLLDNFSDADARRAFNRIDGWLAGQGIWLYTDFQQTQVFWQKILLKSMLLFFRVCCGIKNRHLPDVAACFREYGYKPVIQKEFMNGFILSAVYERIYSSQKQER